MNKIKDIDRGHAKYHGDDHKIKVMAMGRNNIIDGDETAVKDNYENSKIQYKDGITENLRGKVIKDTTPNGGRTHIKKRANT